METTANPQAQDCQLQLILGIHEPCAEDCLFMDRTIGSQGACICRQADPQALMPRGIARSLLKRAGRRTR